MALLTYPQFSNRCFLLTDEVAEVNSSDPSQVLCSAFPNSRAN